LPYRCRWLQELRQDGGNGTPPGLLLSFGHRGTALVQKLRRNAVGTQTKIFLFGPVDAKK
jgi:hypothetical protein